MLEAILHIGTPKTGTSSLQRFLAQNDTLLSEHGLLYPLAGRRHRKRTSSRQVGLALSVLPLDRRDLGFDKIFELDTRDEKAKFQQDFFRDFEAEIANTTAQRVIISDEALYIFVSKTSSIVELSRFLAKFFTKIEIVVYVRSPDRFLESSYSQHLKTGGTHTLDEFANERKGVISYWSRLKLWEDVFGKNSLKVREYDRSLLFHGDIVADFFKEILDIELNISSKVPESNSSISPLGQALLRSINQYFAELKQPRPRFYRKYISRSFAGTGQRLTAEQAARLHAALSDEIAQISTAFFDGRRIFAGFPRPPSEAPSSDAPSASEVTSAAIDMSLSALTRSRSHKRPSASSNSNPQRFGRAVLSKLFAGF